MREKSSQFEGKILLAHIPQEFLSLQQFERFLQIAMIFYYSLPTAYTSW